MNPFLHGALTIIVCLTIVTIYHWTAKGVRAFPQWRADRAIRLATQRRQELQDYRDARFGPKDEQ